MNPPPPVNTADDPVTDAWVAAEALRRLESARRRLDDERGDGAR
jgi:hypothetical protein